jgi:hypothetical protein
MVDGFISTIAAGGYGSPLSRGRPLVEVATLSPSPQIQFLEKIIALVVDDDEGREIHDLDPPDRVVQTVFDLPSPASKPAQQSSG